MKKKPESSGKEANIRFVTDAPAALAGTTLVVADLHIGIEAEFSRRGVRVPSGTGLLKGRLLELVKKTRARELVVLGDVKHKVPGVSFQEERELPRFFSGFPVPVTVAPGNHDPELTRLAPEVNVASSAGFKKGPFYFSHGHAWPARASLACDTIFIGHLHPHIEFRDTIGKMWLEPVWVNAELNKKKMGARYGTVPATLPRLIVVPAFNQLTGTIPLNRAQPDWLEQQSKAIREPIGPLVKCAEMDKAGVTLLDGTYLGKLKSLKQQQP